MFCTVALSVCHIIPHLQQVEKLILPPSCHWGFVESVSSPPDATKSDTADLLNASI